jgi:predicted transcriptional regulator of viral defense system
MIKAASGSGRTRRPPAEKTSRAKAALSASDAVLEVIKAYKEGVGFGEIQEKTGFGEKKLRNIIFRLNKMDKIKRVGRGVYLAL